MTLLRISLFGRVQIDHDSWSSKIKVTPKAQILLGYLLLQGPRSHSRERLAEIFWRDQTPQRARRCLRTTLWRLRSALEPEKTSPGTYLLTTTNDEIGFNWDSNHWLDVTAFEQQLEVVLAQSPQALQTTDVQTLEKTLDLYQGDLLEGFYDNWAVREQERLHALYLDGLEHLMCYYQHQALYAQGVAVGQQILAQEPLHEEIHREVMRLYLASGQRALAVQQYEACRDLLSQELGLSPMTETQALYEQAVAGTDERVRLSHRTPSVDLQEALKRLKRATHRFEETERQLRKAQAKVGQAQQELQQALRLVEQAQQSQSPS